MKTGNVIVSLTVVGEYQLISELRKWEYSLDSNEYFDIDEVANAVVYTDGTFYFSSTKKKIGDGWDLAMYFVRDKYVLY